MDSEQELDDTPDNPYAPPRAELSSKRSDHGHQLATLTQRLLGALLDNMLILVPVILLTMPSFSEETGMLSETFLLALSGFVLLVGFLQLMLLGTRGQTLGKLAAGTRIVGLDGRPAGCGSVILLRTVLNNILTMVPLVGFFYWFIDPTFILRPDRRCIHDHIAGTIVIQA